jgi:hypothetical protein
MTRRKKILSVLLNIALGILVYEIIWPIIELEYLCYIFSIPIIILNMWEWFEPEVMESLFEKEVDPSFNPTKTQGAEQD